MNEFAARARTTLADPKTLRALDESTARLLDHRRTAWAALDDVEVLREAGRRIRERTVLRLDEHLERFADELEAHGGRVHWAGDAAEARQIVIDVCARAGARLAVKSKSMVSEEIGLNAVLEAAGVRTRETDLGEYLLQLAGRPPAHIVAPAIELTKEDCASLLGAVEGVELPPELPELTAAARRQLRREFETADVGITGANFAVAETGSICLVTNEGNGRLTSALPRVHVVLLGLERVVPTLQELTVLLALLARSATGQKLTVNTTLLTGPRREGEIDGPEELHVVVLDNGRSSLLRGRYRTMLSCIRCGSCLNVCPVYRKTGGSAYSDVYSGPMGAVLLPLLRGLDREASLPHASSLCGACTAACPVKIPLHELLLDLRRDLVADGVASRREWLAFWLWSLAWSRPSLYRLSGRVARWARPLGRLAGPGRVWARGRELPRLARRRFRDDV